MKNSLLRRAALQLFPQTYTCDICGVEIFEGHLCPDCAKTVTFNDGAVCPVCGRKTVRAEICLECKAELPRFKKAISAMVYEGGAIALIHKFKNDGAYLKEFFADLLAEKLATFPAYDAMIYVPMTGKAEYRRGYNQSRLLAESLSRRTGVPVLRDAIVKTRDTPEQKGLSRRERAENLSGCFTVPDRKAVKDRKLLLVDDVMTTGATTDELCRKLLAAGATCVYVATVCAVEFRQAREEKKNPQ